MSRVLVTGSKGLIGHALCCQLERMNYEVERLDIAGESHGGEFGDIRNRERVDRGIEGCSGVIHLAAVSRVIWGEKDPALCIATNVEGTRNLLRAAACSGTKPWVLFSSSREVYGEPRVLPVREDHELSHINVYGRTKIVGEQLVCEARGEGLNTAIMRLSNVYGLVSDHPDRVVTAFSRAAAYGEAMRVDGCAHIFDFTHVVDTIEGILRLVKVLESGERNLPPVHFVTGRGTTLGELAEMARSAGGNRSEIYEAPERDYDVSRFVGDPMRAWNLLGWKARIDPAEGVKQLVDDFRTAVS